MIDETEIEDCTKAIEACGFEVNDFEFMPVQFPQDNSEIHAITDRVTVKRSSNGAERSYATRHGKAWVVEFSEDLKYGLFGNAI